MTLELPTWSCLASGTAWSPLEAGLLRDDSQGVEPSSLALNSSMVFVGRSSWEQWPSPANRLWGLTFQFRMAGAAATPAAAACVTTNMRVDYLWRCRQNLVRLGQNYLISHSHLTWPKARRHVDIAQMLHHGLLFKTNPRIMMSWPTCQQRTQLMSFMSMHKLLMMSDVPFKLNGLVNGRERCLFLAYFLFFADLL